jgi:hypothetical protein
MRGIEGLFAPAKEDTNYFIGFHGGVLAIVHFKYMEILWGISRDSKIFCGDFSRQITVCDTDERCKSQAPATITRVILLA